MRHVTPHCSVLLALALSCAPATAAHAAPRKPRPPAGTLIRTIGSRVTVFYQFRTKDGKYHKKASVSKTVFVKVVKPIKQAKPHTP